MEKPANLNTLSNPIRQMLFSYQKFLQAIQPRSTLPRIKVSQVLSSIAFVYEKIRTAIEYKGEHLLRRNAIERILKRILWEKPKSSPDYIASALVRELIWSRYLENDTIPLPCVEKVAKIIRKYQTLALSPQLTNETRALLLGTISCEVEEILLPKMTLDLAYLQSIHNWISGNFDWREKELDEGFKEMQLFIALDRSFLKSDKPRVFYHLLKLHFPAWAKTEDEQILKLKQILPAVLRQIEENFSQPAQLKLYRFLQKQVAPFQILKDLFESQTPAELAQMLADSQKLEGKIKEICALKYAQIDKKIRRGITRSIIYIFVTKVLLALVIEIPYEVFLTKEINRASLILNMLIPPLLMYFIGLTIRRPGEKNTQRITERLKDFVYEEIKEEKIKFSLSPPPKGKIISAVFYILYLIFFVVTFGGILLILRGLHFNFLSTTIFFVFLSLVLLFGMRVRSSATELIVIGEKEGLPSHILTNLTLPLLNFGTFLSRGLAKLNFLMILMDFLIEAPLKTIISAFAEWSSFVNEKREEIVEVPEN